MLWDLVPGPEMFAHLPHVSYVDIDTHHKGRCRVWPCNQTRWAAETTLTRVVRLTRRPGRVCLSGRLEGRKKGVHVMPRVPGTEGPLP